MNRHKAYTALLMRHRTMLWRMCWRWVGGDCDRCRDIMQEVSLAMWENFDKLRPDATPAQQRSWVRWQARSVFYQVGRRGKLRTEPLTVELADSVAEEQDNLRERLDDLMSALDTDDQRMLQLYLDGYQGDEIGKQMGINRDAYYQRMHRAIKK